MLKSKIESILFIAGKSMTAKKMAELLAAKEAEIGNALKELQAQYSQAQSGVQIFSTGTQWQMGTIGENAEVVAQYVKEEFSGELTRPQLETLTVIAYRGPISKIELEIIRGVSCGLILRNLLIRGLVDEEYDAKRKETKYRISLEFVRHLGISRVEDLPEYEKLHGHEVMETLLQNQRELTSTNIGH